MDKLTWRSALSRFSWDHPYLVLGTIILLTLGFTAFFPWIQINTDPEDMLPEDHPARVEDRSVKEEFFLHDYVAIALEPSAGETAIDETRLRRLHELVRRVEKQEGVISQDILSLYTSDDIEGTPGGLNIDRLLRSPPDSREAIDHLIRRVEGHPILEGMILNPESGGLALFVPIEAKHYSYPLRQEVHSFWEQQPEGAGEIHVAGLPVAEETFGVQMFYQMATSAPLAFLIIGLLMLLFFRSLSLVVWSLLQAVFTVLWAMGGLIGLGFTVHIMSSMIPIFLLPISVVDSIHILSDFTDRLAERADETKRRVMAGVYEDIFLAILFTSLTSAAGFTSLIMTGIPPVEIFGVTVGLGILLAFLMTLTVLPAGAAIWTPRPTSGGGTAWIARLVRWNGSFARRHSLPILLTGLVLLGAGLYGMTMIQVNDNPTRWFHSDHPIRQADRYFNRAFAGSYPAYWVLPGRKGGWYEPEALRRLEGLMNEVQQTPEVGRVTGLPSLVRKIHDELHGGEAPTDYPDSKRAVQQYLFLYENSGNPQDLFRLVTPEGDRVNVWFNLKSGDNRVMASVQRRAQALLDDSEVTLSDPPEWAGVTVVNLIWQNVMVRGMGWALAGGCGVIFLMMLLLFRSPRWAVLSMVPLAVTLVFVYGLIGWIGKDYDMPVAVLSALSMGIAVDFAIHFIQRSRQLMREERDWASLMERVAGEPSRAIARNAVVIAVGFTPLLVAPLRPYVTVGVFMVLIMAFSGLATLTGLTASFEQLKRVLPLAPSSDSSDASPE